MDRLSLTSAPPRRGTCARRGGCVNAGLPAIGVWREPAAEAIIQLAPEAGARGVRLGIEPMHPIFAADRGVVSTLHQALDLAEHFPTIHVGVVVDTFHLLWEPGILDQIARARDRIICYQIGDWINAASARRAARLAASSRMAGHGHHGTVAAVADTSSRTCCIYLAPT